MEEGVAFRFNFGGDASEAPRDGDEGPRDEGPVLGADASAPAPGRPAAIIVPASVVDPALVPDPVPGWTPERVVVDRFAFVKGGAASAAATLARDVTPDALASDLVRGAYEGGGKLWECAMDLARFVCADEETLRRVAPPPPPRRKSPPGGENDDKPRRAKVIELGCGHAIPAMTLAALGADDVVLADYNPEVLRELTVPNVRANFFPAARPRPQEAPEEPEPEPEPGIRLPARRPTPEFTFLAGDWGEQLERCAKEERLEEGRRRREGPEAELEGSPSDVVVSPSDAAGKERKNAAKSLVSFSAALRDADVTLCAETIYDARSYPAHVAMLERCVRAPDGVALIAAKRYYFGVGGGTRAFAEALAESGAFECDVAATYADGASNVREILRVRRRNAERGGDGNQPTRSGPRGRARATADRRATLSSSSRFITLLPGERRARCYRVASSSWENSSAAASRNFTRASFLCENSACSANASSPKVFSRPSGVKTEFQLALPCLTSPRGGPRIAPSMTPT